jgi:hypothetical protein
MYVYTYVCIYVCISETEAILSECYEMKYSLFSEIRSEIYFKCYHNNAKNSKRYHENLKPPGNLDPRI